jgi:hypothetical protein
MSYTSTPESFSTLGLAIALLLPWILGTALVRSLLHNSKSWNWFVVVGHGYFLGLFVVTLLMRAADSVGLATNFMFLASVTSALALLAIVFQSRREPVQGNVLAYQNPGTLGIVLVAFFLSLMAWRYAAVFQELLLRPLFAWDSVMNWSPKAVVWFNIGELQSLIRPEKWLSQGLEGQAHTLANRAAIDYPPTVPLILLWSMISAGTTEHSALYLPWGLAAVNIGLALYGHLRLAGLNPVVAIIGSYVLLNMPLFNTHAALPGMADLWLGIVFGLAVCSAREWRHQRTWGWLVLFLVFSIMCAQLKNPGKALTVILLLAMAMSMLRIKLYSLVLVSAVGAMCAWYGLTQGIEFDIPGLGTFILDHTKLVVPGMGTYHIIAQSSHDNFLISMLIMINWNILWPLLGVLTICIFRRMRPGSDVSFEALAVIGVLIFLAYVFNFTPYTLKTDSYVTLNRAILYVIPALVYYAFLNLHAWPWWQSAESAQANDGSNSS